SRARRARAVRPWRPMTLPTSFSATSSSITPSSNFSTKTSSGESTSSFAINSRSAQISPDGSGIDSHGGNEMETRKSADDLRGRGRRGGWGLRINLVHPLRHLRALRYPIVHTFALQLNAGRVGTGIVRPHHFHR